VKYRLLDQTSDLGVEIFGKDLPELFSNACFAVFDNMVHLERIESRTVRTIELRSDSLDALFLDWLRELLFRFSTEYFVVKDVPILKLDGSHLIAEVRGERFDPERHEIKIEIKTPTYHMFKIDQNVAGYCATVVLDV
jgi:SHS2 domain-containing protein